jgi:D-beta-D-heptose 7-phosphate kinase/D-beta-D-heptose 1-phosphate adenosyltransferase
MMNYSKTKKLLKKLQGLKVAVLGDLMLDKYLFGEVTRISPEAPVPIVSVTKETSILGGAANVAENLRAIGAEPILIGTIQQDEAGEQIVTPLQKFGISTDWIVSDPNKPTTVKTRVIGQKQQILRIDRENTECCKQIIVDKLCICLEQALESAAVLIVSDYVKGVVNLGVMNHVRKLCKAKEIPWIVDPKPSQIALYDGATLMTPNTKELQGLSGMSAKNNSELIAASQHLVNKLNLQGLLVTRSEKGMALFYANHVNGVPHLIPTKAKEVFDISGAGDTVIAIFSAAISVGSDWRDAAMLANTAAGIVVGKMGTATVTPTEILQYYKS